MKKPACAIAVAGLLATPAFAADMAVKMPVKTPPHAPVYSWTGCYLGGNVGGAWQHNDTFDAVAIFDTGGDSGSSVVSHFVAHFAGGQDCG